MKFTPKKNVRRYVRFAVETEEGVQLRTNAKGGFDHPTLGHIKEASQEELVTLHKKDAQVVESLYDVQKSSKGTSTKETGTEKKDNSKPSTSKTSKK